MRTVVNLSIRIIFGACLLSLASACQHPPVSKTSKVPDIIDFHVSLTPNIETGVVYGVQKMMVRLPESPTQTMSFTSGALKDLEMFVNGRKVDVKLVDGQRVLPLVFAEHPKELVEITARYSSRPTRGYTVDKSNLYTEYFACDWMICEQENFSDKATITLELNLPRKLESIGPGKLLDSKWLPNGLHQTTWRSDIAYPPYIYAFAFGDFVTVKEQVGNVSLKYVSGVVGEETLKKLFSPTANMLNFFEEKAGAPFPQEEYTQLYVEGRSAQEAVSHSVIGDRSLKLILTDPKEDWVIAHELAHQWWGNSVTCSDISEFWLNEGITTFMVAAWKEYRWGHSAYERELEFAKKRYQKAIDAGMDVPLAYAGKYPSLGIRRNIQYSKGAIFMDVLRSLIGENAFWAGLRNYTSEHMGKTVTSPDLQLAFERASKRDLSQIFSEWVYDGAHIRLK